MDDEGRASDTFRFGGGTADAATHGTMRSSESYGMSAMFLASSHSPLEKLNLIIIEAAADSDADAVGLDEAGLEERVVDVPAQFIEGVRLVLHSVAGFRPGCAAM